MFTWQEMKHLNEINNMVLRLKSKNKQKATEGEMLKQKGPGFWMRTVLYFYIFQFEKLILYQTYRMGNGEKIRMLMIHLGGRWVVLRFLIMIFT